MDNSWKQQLTIELNLNNRLNTEYICHTYIYHKLNGPAIIYHDGSKKWFMYNKLYNPNGPTELIANSYKK